MKKLSTGIACILFFVSTIGLGASSAPVSKNKSSGEAAVPSKSEFSIIGGILIAASLGIGYSAKRFYLIRSDSEQKPVN